MRSLRTPLLLAALLCGAAAAQTPVPPPSVRPDAAEAAPPRSSLQVTAVRHDLLGYLRSTPTAAQVLSADPTLMADAAYLARTNPELAQFVQQHPEVARNPEFYLFADLGPGDPAQALERRLWPDHFDSPANGFREISNVLIPFLVFLVVAGFLTWLLRTLLENRRWTRLMRTQSEVHGRLMERFESSQDLLAYLQSEPGRRFLESAPLATGFDPSPRGGAMAARVLLALQIGIVAAAAGTALTALRNSIAGAHDPLLTLGLLSLAIGVGFVLSAAVSFLMAKHLGLLPAAAGDTVR